MVPSLRTADSRRASRCASVIGSGISSGVSSQAKPNIMPWSPAPWRVERVVGARRCAARSASSTPCAMSGDCAPIATLTPQEAPSKPFFEES